MNVSLQTATQFLKGEETAISEVYRAYRKLLYFIIATYVPSKEEAADVYQETFLKVLSKREELKNPAALHTYLCQSAKNCAIDYLKKKQTNLDPELEETLVGEENASLDSLLPFDLTPEEKAIAGYHLGFELSWKEISELTGIPVSTAKLRYASAKKKIKEAYSK